MITCTGEVFTEGGFRPCDKPATALLTVTGADRGKDLRPESYSTPYNLDNAPRCAGCLAVDRRVVQKFYPMGWTFTADPINPADPGRPVP